MKKAGNQPYFFPYLGYFGLIKHTDLWIVFDIAQYVNSGWINRNRILRPVQGWQYITVPVKKHSLKTAIKDIEIANDKKWKDKIFAKLKVYRNIAPYYLEIINLIERALSFNTGSISELNCNTTKVICNYLDIEWNYSVFSEMNLKIEDKINAPDDWPLYICKSLSNISELWNLPGGNNFFDKQKFIRNNIKLNFFNQNLMPYDQKRLPFESRLSIIDVLMFNSKEEIHKQLDNYNFIT